MLSAPLAAMPAVGAAQLSRRRLWKSSAATLTATGCCLGRAVSPLNAWSFVWSVARSAIAVRSSLRSVRKHWNWTTPSGGQSWGQILWHWSYCIDQVKQILGYWAIHVRISAKKTEPGCICHSYFCLFLHRGWLFYLEAVIPDVLMFQDLRK